MKDVVLFGADSFTKVLFSLLELLEYNVAYILDDDAASTGTECCGRTVRNSLNVDAGEGPILGVLSMQDNRTRESAVRRFAHVQWMTVVHPTAFVDPSARLGTGCYVGAGAIINAGAILGDFVMVHSGASVGHDCVIEDFAGLEAGVRLGGGTRIGRGARCQIGSVSIPNGSIGAWARLGPRAAAVSPVPERTVFGGVPAHRMQEVTELGSPDRVHLLGNEHRFSAGFRDQDLVTVLVSSAGRRVELIRCLRFDAAALGLRLRVVAVDVEPEMSSACRAADKFYRVAPCSSPDFVRTLLTICEEEKVRLIIPTIDPELQVFADHRSQFDAVGTRVLVSSPEFVRMAGDKASTAQYLASKGIPTPRTARMDEMLRDPGSWTWPMILKPAHGSASVGICIAKTVEDARVAATKRSDYVAQEFVKGDEYTVNLFFDKFGKIRTVVPHLRCEARSGEVSKGITRKNPALLEVAWRLGSLMEGASGVLCFQAILPKQGPPMVFEINARFGGGYPLAHQAGACFTKWLLEEILDLPSSINDSWQDGLMMLRYDAAIFTQSKPDHD